MMVVGGENVLITNPRDIPGIRQGARQHKYTHHHRRQYALQRAPQQRPISRSSISRACSSPSAAAWRCRRPWPSAGSRSPAGAHRRATGSPRPRPRRRRTRTAATEFSGPIGLPMSSTEIVLRDDNDRDVPLGQPGEICIRGPQVMAGYWQRPDETAKAIGKTASSTPATSASWTTRASSGSSTARRT